MSNDELVKFAAEKVGGEAIEVIVVNKPVTEWRVRLSAVVGFSQFDLTSPDLFFKGLAAMPEHLSWDIDGDGLEQYVLICDLAKCDPNYVKRWDKPSEIPQKFWECWAEAEGVELK